MINKKWQWYSTLFENVRDAFRAFLKENSIYYECSSCFYGYNFEVKASDTQFVCIDKFWNSLPRLLNAIEDLDVPEFMEEVA